MGGVSNYRDCHHVLKTDKRDFYCGFFNTLVKVKCLLVCTVEIYALLQGLVGALPLKCDQIAGSTWLYMCIQGFGYDGIDAFLVLVQ